VLDSSLRPRLDQGRLWVYSTRAHRRLTLLRLAWQTLTREIDETDGLEKIDVNEATLVHERDTPSPLAIDGELAHLRPPFRFRIRPGALRVLAPAA
jgi:diacylglycerol kinase family enzyme